MLKIGVLGAGHLGKIHLRQIRELPELFELVGFYDAQPEVAQSVAAEFGITAFSSQEELINKVDVVDVVTPTLFHMEGAGKALRRSKHVFIEKPLANTLQEARELIRLAQEADMKVQV